MAKSPITVQNFQESLANRIMERGKVEIQQLVDLKREDLNQSDVKLKPWDTSYYSNIQKNRFYQVDEEEIKNFFPTQHVIEETLKIYQELFGLKFTKLPHA